MALFYQSGRVSRFAVGVPGFSTNRDLVLDVDGAIGIDTSEPRGSIDTPEISIRGDIIDSSNEVGANAYYLSRDTNGVRWRAGNPDRLQVINIQDDGSQVGFGSFDTLNFIGVNDPFVVEIDQGAVNTTLANIRIDVRFTKTQYGDSFGLSTSFGPDGTFWSLPGYGTSDAVGVTSIGIGTIQPQADFQVGIGSTGVQIYGAEGKLEAEIIKADNLELDGNLTAESLVIDPGIATFRGNIDAQGISSFTGDITAGVATVADLTADAFFGEQVVTGLSTFGVGLGSTGFIFIESNLEVQGGIATFTDDVYVGNDLYVAGETFFNQINAENIIVAGIATINEFESLVGASTNFSAGIATIGQVGFNTGIGTDLKLESSTIGILTATNIASGVATIGFASLTDAVVSGAVTVTRVDVEEIDIERAGVGILTVGLGFTETDPTFFRTGVGTIVGFTTVTGDFFVDGDLTVTQQFTVKDLGAENLEVTGIGTIVNLRSDVGIVTTLFTEGQINTGVSSFTDIDTNNIDADSGNIGGVDFEGGGDIAGEDLEFETGRIGILTGNILDYNVGFLTFLSAGVGTISTITGNNLSISDFSTINGVSFANTEVVVQQTLKVIDQNGFGIELGDISDTRTGLTTVAGDLYVGNDLYVFGTQFIKNLISENLYVSGIGTLAEAYVDSGIATSFDIDNLKAGLGTITNLISTASTITELDATTVAVSTDPNKYPTVPGQIFADSTFFEFNVAENALVSVAQTIGFSGSTAGRLDLNGQLEVAGISSFRDDVSIDEDLSVAGLTTTRDLFVSGIATINELDVDLVDADVINAGIITVGDLRVTGVTTFAGPVTIEDIIFINQEVTGVSTVNNQVVTGISTVNDARIGFASVGVATVGLLSVTNVEATSIDSQFTNSGVSTVGILSVTESTSLVGPTTITGITSVFGDMVIDGDLTVTGIATYAQLDAEQAQIGILTTKTLLDANGFVDAENVAIQSSFQSNAGVSTLGFTTITDSLHIDNNLFVGGITTFAGVVNIDEVEFVELSVTGVATIGTLYYGTGIGTELSVGVATAGALTVTGPSTFTGVGTFQNDLYVSEDLYVERNVLVGSALTVPDLTVTELVNVSGAASITNASIGVATIGFASITNEVVGTSTVGFISVTDGNISGIVTFTGEIDIDANVDIDGLLRVNDLIVTGVSTFNLVDAGQAEIDILETTEATISTSRIGFSSVGILTVGFGSVTEPSFFRTGVGTIVGFTTITGDLFVDGDVTVTGVSSYAQLDAEQSRIGILTVNKYLDADFIGSGPIGFATFNDISANSGVFTSIGATNVNVTGVLTATELDVTDLEVSRNLLVGGISTLGSANTVTGFTTVVSDLYVGGNLYVQDDIFKDEIIGRNAYISGVGTINNLYVNTGLATYFGADTLNAQVGLITALTSEDATVDTATLGFATVTGALNVTGVSTFVGLSSFQNDVDFAQDVDIRGALDVTGQIDGSDVFLSGAIAGAAASFTDALMGDIFVTGITTTNFLNVAIAGTFTNLTGSGLSVTSIDAINIDSDFIGNSGLTTSLDLSVARNTFLENVTVNGEAIINDGLEVIGDLIVSRNLSVAGISTALASEVSTNLLVGSATTTTSLTVNGGFFNATGISTFENGLRVNNGLIADTATIGSGIVTTINGTTLTYADATISDSLTVVGTSQFTGISTFNNIDVQATANINTLNTTLANIASGFATSLVVDNLTYNVGNGTDLTVRSADITNASIGVATVSIAELQEAEVGVGTVLNQLNYKDVVTTDAVRVVTSSTSDTLLFSLNTAFRSAEYTITAEGATDIESTKIHCASFGSNVFFNEYSVVGSGPSLGTYNVVNNGGATELRVVPPTGDSIEYTVYVVAHI